MQEVLNFRFFVKPVFVKELWEGIVGTIKSLKGSGDNFKKMGVNSQYLD